MSDIVLVTHWTGGDVYPFIRFGKMLQQQGHRVTLLTHCVYADQAQAAGLGFVAVDTEDEYEHLNRDLPMLADPLGKKEDYVHFHQVYHGKERLLREVALIEQVATEHSIIIARHRSSISGLLAAEKNHLPYASMILAPNYFSHMELHDQLFGEDFCKEINQARSQLQMSPIANWKDWLYSPKHILCGWPEWYAQADETWPESAETIGFIEETISNGSDEQNEELSAFINEARQTEQKLVIITGGSSRMVSKSFYQKAIQGCVQASVCAIVVTPYKEYLPEVLPHNVVWVHHVSLRNLMKQVDIVIHHGGMGTINEAIDAALPQVVMPHLTDGPDNADRLVKMGVAVKLPPLLWDENRIAENLTTLLEGNIKEQCIHYRDMNRETYDAKLWKDVIPQIGPCEPFQPKQQNTEHGVNTASVNQLPKNVLLEIIRKKQRKGE